MREASAPPPPPPPDPSPVVAVARPVVVAIPAHRLPLLTRGLPRWVDLVPAPIVTVSAWLGGELRPASERHTDARLAAFPALWRAAVRELVEALAFDLAGDRGLVGRIGLGGP